MANQLATQQTIDLTSELSTNLNKNKIAPFKGFNVRKNPYLNGCLKTYQEEMKEGQVVDSNGNVYQWAENGDFLINGEVKDNIPLGTIVSEELDTSWAEGIENLNQYFYLGENRWLYTAGSNNALFLRENSIDYDLNYNIYNTFSIQKYFDFVVIKYLNVYTHYNQKILNLKVKGFLNVQLQDENTAYYYITELKIGEENYYKLVTRTSGSGFRCFILNDISLDAEYSFYSDLPETVIEGLSGYKYVAPGNHMFYFYKLDDHYFKLGEIIYNFSKTDGEWSCTVSYTGGLNSFYIEDYKIFNNKDYFIGFSEIFHRENSSSDFKVANNLYRGLGVKNYNCNSGGYDVDEESNAIKFNTVHTNKAGFKILYNAGVISGISYAVEDDEEGALLIPWYDVDTSISFPYFIEDGVCYLNKDNKLILLKKTNNNKIKIVDNCILLNSYRNKNCFNFIKKEWSNFASDWNNRIYHSEGTGVTKKYLTASGRVDYINNYDSVVTSITSPVFYYFDSSDVIFNQKIHPYCVKNNIDIYIGETGNVPYKFSYKNSNKIINAKLEGTSYPIATDGNVLLNPSLNAEFYETNFMMDYIKEGDAYYSLIYNNGKPIFLYAYGSQLGSLDNIFIIQGQIYIIRNNIICSATIENNVVQNISAIVSSGNMRFLGSSVSTAYFYSEADKYIYIFTGDRKLNRMVEMSELINVRYSKYDTNTNSFFLISDNGCYIIMDESFFFKINGDYEEVAFTVEGFALKVKDEESLKVFKYYGDENIPVEFETAFYGLGDNRLSVIDCWYIRLYCAKPKDGTIECSIVTMTDEVKESNKQIFNVTKSDWDEITQTYLIRYQPKYQRSIGTSLKLKSDFDVQDVQCSFVQDSALQISKVTNNKIIAGVKI